MLFARYGNDDMGAPKRHSYNTSRNQRFSRHRNRDRLRQERHTIEADRAPQRCARASTCNVFYFETKLALRNVSRAGNKGLSGDNSKFVSFWLTHSRYHGTSMDRAQRNRQSYQRSHSIARFENHSNDNGKRRPDPANRSYTMTLPASHGRHRSRINGDFRTLTESLTFLPPHFFSLRHSDQISPTPLALPSRQKPVPSPWTRASTRARTRRPCCATSTPSTRCCGAKANARRRPATLSTVPAPCHGRRTATKICCHRRATRRRTGNGTA